MNNVVKEYAVENNAAGMKELFLKLRFGIYLMAALAILVKSIVRMYLCSLIEQ